MGKTAENFVYAEDLIIDSLCLIFKKALRIRSSDRFSEIGLITPVFKKKGRNTDSKNYRGITVIPIHTKVLELVIRARLKQLILERQNKLQRGFAEKSSPMNTALILEEYIRERHDIQAPAYLAFLDAKSLFDVVSHMSLMCKPFNIGVEGNMWTIINSLHQDARSAFKWQGEISKQFRVEQDVRQGGILSTRCTSISFSKKLAVV